LTIFTSFKIECISEIGKDYRVNISESVGKGTLRLYKTTCGVQNISDKVTEIGAFRFVKWYKVKSGQKGWKPGNQEKLIEHALQDKSLTL